MPLQLVGFRDRRLPADVGETHCATRHLFLPRSLPRLARSSQANMLRTLASKATLTRSARRAFSTTARRTHTPLSALSTTPEFSNSVRQGTIPAFRLLGPDGALTDDAAAQSWVEKAKEVDGDKLKRMLEVMTMMPILVRLACSPSRRSWSK